MKRTHVYNYEIWGSVTQWPVKVYLRRVAKAHWRVDFEYVDPEAKASVSHVAEEAGDFVQIAEERHMDLGSFIKALHAATQVELRELGEDIESAQRKVTK